MNRTKMIIMAYFIVLALYGITEILLQLKFSNWKIEKKGKDLLPILLPFY